MIRVLVKKILSLLNLKISKIKNIILSDISIDEYKHNNLFKLQNYKSSKNKQFTLYKNYRYNLKKSWIISKFFGIFTMS